MLNNQASESKHASLVVIDGTIGVKGNAEFKVHIENRLRVEISGVGVGNVIAIEARITNSSLWTSLASFTGLTGGLVDISTYDFIRFNVTTASGTGTCISSGFISMF
jgi:hypothetical protein